MKRLRRLKIDFSSDENGHVRIPAANNQVGDLLASFDDDEITVCIGSITHCHFTPGACGDLNAADPVQEAVASAGQYVCEILDDKWVLWGNEAGFGGSFRDDGEEVGLPKNARKYRWSGPIE